MTLYGHIIPARPAPHRVLARRAVPIKAALEWAFGTEHASLDFAEDQGDNARPGVSPLWTVMQRGALGCSIDGGGYSLPARDADIIASEVAHLPRALGGRAMALRLAELARAGQVPDWGHDLRMRCIPARWKCENQYGPQADTVLVGFDRITVNGRVRDVEVRACPVVYTATADRISAARRQYHDWCDALAHLALTLRTKGLLDRIRITAELPDLEPWGMRDAERRVG